MSVTVWQLEKMLVAALEEQATEVQAEDGHVRAKILGDDQLHDGTLAFAWLDVTRLARDLERDLAAEAGL